MTNSETEYRMLPVPEALDIVLGECRALPVAHVAFGEALGMTLAQDVVAGEPLPPFSASVKDGYAVVAADGTGEYPLVGEVRAGRLASFHVHPGTVAYITTGAPLPSGADAVVMVEDTARFERDGMPWVRIGASVQAGDDVRPVGVDVATGQVVLTHGETLGPAELGLLATVGACEVPVHARPVVAVLSTGDELVEPSRQLGPGQIRDSNRAGLLGAIAAVGGVPLDLGIVADDSAALASAIQRGVAEADILLTTGGVSMGDLDLVKPLLEKIGRVHFGRLRMKPGKPLTFATVPKPSPGEGAPVANCLVFGLPGNPVSSMVTFLLLVAPAIRKLCGQPNPHWPVVRAALTESLALDNFRPEYHRALLRWDNAANEGSGGFTATSTGRQVSSRLLSMRTANALLCLPVGEGKLAAGSQVDALVIGSF